MYGSQVAMMMVLGGRGRVLQHCLHVHVQSNARSLPTLSGDDICLWCSTSVCDVFLHLPKSGPCNQSEMRMQVKAVGHPHSTPNLVSSRMCEDPCTCSPLENTFTCPCVFQGHPVAETPVWISDFSSQEAWCHGQQMTRARHALCCCPLHTAQPPLVFSPGKFLGSDLPGVCINHG